MSSTNGASGGGSGSNKESFDDLFKTIQKLEEKVQTDAARHNVNVVTLKNELSRQKSRYYELKIISDRIRVILRQITQNH